jgi:hypothetical protein
LVKNPEYTYTWVDSYYGADVPNGVYTNWGGPETERIYTGRVQQDGHTYVGSISLYEGMYYDGPDFFEVITRTYQALTCVPKPANLCSNFLNLII